jgi:hypothetical protein
MSKSIGFCNLFIKKAALKDIIYFAAGNPTPILLIMFCNWITNILDTNIFNKYIKTALYL